MVDDNLEITEQGLDEPLLNETDLSVGRQSSSGPSTSADTGSEPGVAIKDQTAMHGANKSQRLCTGIFMLVLVDIIWVLSSELTNYLFFKADFKKPYFTTYFKTSLLTIYLSGFLFWSPWKDQLRRRTKYVFIDPNCSDDSFSINNGSIESPLSDSMYVPIRFHDSSGSGDKSSGTESDDTNKTRSVRFSKLTEVRHLSESQADDALLARLSYSASARAEERARLQANKFSLKRVLMLAFVFSFLWFLGNYSYQRSLALSEVGVVNVLSSGSSFFTLILAALLPSQPNDRFTLSKFIAVISSVTGIIIISISDMKLDPSGPVPWGCVWALLGALCFALYLVLIRRRVPSEDKMDLPMFFGFVGLFSTFLLWPGLLIMHFTGEELLEWPDGKAWACLIANGLIGTVLAELLWLWACFMTSSLLATLSLSLTIPMSMVADVLLRRVQYPSLFLLGCLPVLVSYVATAVLQHYDNWDPVMEAINRVVHSLCKLRRNAVNSRLRDADTEQTESLIGVESNEEHNA